MSTAILIIMLNNLHGVQRLLRSALESAQSDDGLRPAFLLRNHRLFMRTGKTLIRLCGLTGRSTSSTGAQFNFKICYAFLNYCFVRGLICMAFVYLVKTSLSHFPQKYFWLDTTFQSIGIFMNLLAYSSSRGSIAHSLSLLPPIVLM